MLLIQNDGCFCQNLKPVTLPNSPHPQPPSPPVVIGYRENVVLVEYNVFILPIVYLEKYSKNTSCIEEKCRSFFWTIFYFCLFLVHVAMTVWIVSKSGEPRLILRYFTRYCVIAHIATRTLSNASTSGRLLFIVRFQGFHDFFSFFLLCKWMKTEKALRRGRHADHALPFRSTITDTSLVM